MEKISYEEFAEQYLSGSVKKSFIDGIIENERLGEGPKDFRSISQFINCAFPWSATPEGSRFWIDVASNLSKNPKHYAPKNQTYREFAKKYLSGDIYSKFVKNCVVMNSRGFIDRPSMFVREDSDDFFYGAFIWSDSPEGFLYWSEAAEKFKKDPTVFQFKPYVWVVFSEGSKRLLDVFSSEEEATKCWDGCSGYVIKKFVRAEV